MSANSASATIAADFLPAFDPDRSAKGLGMKVVTTLARQLGGRPNQFTKVPVKPDLFNLQLSLKASPKHGAFPQSRAKIVPNKRIGPLLPA